MKRYCIFILIALLCYACHKQTERVVAPWGEELGREQQADDDFDLDMIEQAGELIVLTLSGPDTYYDFQGRVFGLHAMLCQHLADTLGVRLRIETCKDSVEMHQRLEQGEADLIAYPVTKPDSVWPGWVIADDKPMLKREISLWYNDARMTSTQQEEQQLLKAPRVQRTVFAPMLNRSGGVISHYDGLFQKYSQAIHWDWRLMAAQCYQESTFDPHATSWAGARGLMQIMPQTAEHLGVPKEQLTQPEKNIAAAAQYLEELDKSFTDIHDKRERQYFVLASYNGGPHHIRDAMALAKRDGKNSFRWESVSSYVLLLSDARYYQDPLVKNGYMRGSETVDYVKSIFQRYQQYKGVKGVFQPAGSTPQKSKNAQHRRKYSV